MTEAVASGADGAERTRVAVPLPAAPASRGLLFERDVTVDGLRGLAVLLVVLRHVLRGDVFGELPVHSLNLGRMGVQLFFVISGFVIGALLTDRGPSLRAAPRFLARRMARLSPPYFAAIALALLLFDVASRVNPSGTYLSLQPDLLACSLAYVCWPLGLPLYLNVGWSLEIEAQFYLAASVLVPLALAGGARTAWLAAACLLSLAPFVPEEFALHYAPPFALGMALVAYRRGAFGLHALTLIILCLGVYWAALLREPETGAMVALGAFAIALRVRMPAALVWVGGISYSLYLVHVPLAPLFVSGLRRFGVPVLGAWTWLWCAVALAGSIAAAWLLHRFVERPATRWSRTIAPAGAAPARAAASAAG
jgi:peptidoglycan/LPS O-acetylase OafA/YrhL